ncbi:MAG: cation transporter [Sedimentisphaerales bacterium]|nr:cation transporter [Sedimentisphaerales bacterium]
MTKILAVEAANAQIRRVTITGMCINITLMLFKIIVGFLVGSLSLIADGVHSLSDFATDIAILVGVHFSAKKPDEKHPFGHGRAETFSGAFVASVLIGVGGLLIYEGAVGIAEMHHHDGEKVQISWLVIWIALLSVGLKEYLYHITRTVARQTNSAATYANAWHHRSDAFSSVAVLIGAVAVKFGYPHGDQLGAIAVGLMIVMVGIKIISECISEFAEGAVDAATLRQIQSVINSHQDIRQWHQLRTRSVGREVFLDVHILVDPSLNITQAHEIAESLETALIEQLTRPVNVMVHVEPDLPELRR